jgi:hypothetical protein
MLCAGSMLLLVKKLPRQLCTSIFWCHCPECPEASKHQPSKVWLSPTGSINLGFIIEGNLLLCSSYLPLEVPNWVPTPHHHLPTPPMVIWIPMIPKSASLPTPSCSRCFGIGLSWSLSGTLLLKTGFEAAGKRIEGKGEEGCARGSSLGVGGGAAAMVIRRCYIPNLPSPPLRPLGLLLTFSGKASSSPMSHKRRKVIYAGTCGPAHIFQLFPYQNRGLPRTKIKGHVATAPHKSSSCL